MRPRLTTGLPFSPWHSGLGGLSVFAGRKLDRTCVYESGGKIQVVQLRRILLLFALVLGLSALVAALAPPPDESGERDEPAVEASPRSGAPPRVVRLAVPRGTETPPTRRVAPGARVSLEVTVSRAGEVEIDELGLRQAADPRAPARFEFIAPRTGQADLVFHPVGGRARLAGRLSFAGARRSGRDGA